MSVPTAPIVASGLIGGYASARYTGSRELASGVFMAAGAWCTRSWLRSSGRGVAGALLGTYVAAFVVSHPLARKIGAWPAVLAVTAAAAGVTVAVADQPSESSVS
jgi:hypothetical protein